MGTFISSDMRLRSNRMIGTEQNDDLCKICSSVRYYPLLFHTCFHSFCAPCIRESLIKDIQTNMTVKCPICRDMIVVDIHYSIDIVHILVDIEIDPETERLKHQYPIDYCERDIFERQNMTPEIEEYMKNPKMFILLEIDKRVARLMMDEDEKGDRSKN